MVTACELCTDGASIARVVTLRNGVATVDADGCRSKVVVDLVPDARVGDLLLCHAGVALQRVEKS